MSKFTRRIHKYKRNKSNKRGGSIQPFEERKGIFDIASDKLGAATSALANKVEDIGLNSLGLEKKGMSAENINENINNITNTGTKVASDISNKMNETSANMVDGINEVLASDEVNHSVQEAAQTTAQISGQLAKHFNDAMNDPEVKEQLEEAIEHAGELGDVIVKSSEEPLKEAVKIGVEAGTDALGAASAGIIKVGTDMMAAVPGLGAVIEVGKMLNDGSKAVSAVAEASSKAISTASDAFSITSENVKKGLRELEEQKKLAQQITNRTNRSINHFESPLIDREKERGKEQEQGLKKEPENRLMGGSRKTKRRLFQKKHKPKTKSVRFAI